MNESTVRPASRRVLVVGGGAREHALSHALRAAGAEQVWVAPGNGGTASATGVENIALNSDDVDALVAFARANAVELVVVGPEAPLTLGLVDRLDALKIAAFGPSREAAQLEGSKAFMKEFCRRHAIPTAPFAVFHDADEAEAYVRAAARPLVVKADGLCAGKGVVVAADTDEALAAVRRMMRDREFGNAGARVVIEELLAGEEASFHVVSDGERYAVLAPAQDHKRLLDGDRGPNTGGMGAYAPAPVVTRDVTEKVLRRIVEPTLAGMRNEGRPFRGALFAGLMIDGGEPSLLEFNVRFGDPETCVLVPTYAGNWLRLLDAAARGELVSSAVAPTSGAALCVVMAAEGYPGAPTTGDAIIIGDGTRDDGIFLFHAGTRRGNDGALRTSGGRVLAVCALAGDIEGAATLAYDAVSRIHFRGAQHRRDIGHSARSVAP